MRKQMLAQILIVLLLIISTSRSAAARPEGGGQHNHADNISAEYTLAIQAENGYVIKQPDQAVYQAAQTVRLISRPTDRLLYLPFVLK